MIKRKVMGTDLFTPQEDKRLELFIRLFNRLTTEDLEVIEKSFRPKMKKRNEKQASGNGVKFG